jgi:hypothetical protein
MIEKLSSAPSKVKNHVVKHRAKYTFVATATAALGLQMQTADKFNTFLESKGLLEEFYSLNES